LDTTIVRLSSDWMIHMVLMRNLHSAPKLPKEKITSTGHLVFNNIKPVHTFSLPSRSEVVEIIHMKHGLKFNTTFIFSPKVQWQTISFASKHLDRIFANMEHGSPVSHKCQRLVVDTWTNNKPLYIICPYKSVLCKPL